MVVPKPCQILVILSEKEVANLSKRIVEDLNLRGTQARLTRPFTTQDSSFRQQFADTMAMEKKSCHTTAIVMATAIATATAMP